jgi:hypothetical protein
MTGEVLGPRRPVLAAAQGAGEVTPEQVQVIVRALDGVDRAGVDRAGVDRAGVDPADIAAGQQLLTQQASTFEPTVLAQRADPVVSAIDPDGTLPDDRLVGDRRHFSIRAIRDGGHVGEFRLTGGLGAKLSAILRPLAKPRLDNPRPSLIGESGAGPLLVVRDERSNGQRMHDALEEVCDRVLRSGTFRIPGGRRQR